MAFEALSWKTRAGGLHERLKVGIPSSSASTLAPSSCAGSAQGSLFSSEDSRQLYDSFADWQGLDSEPGNMPTVQAPRKPADGGSRRHWILPPPPSARPSPEPLSGGKAQASKSGRHWMLGPKREEALVAGEEDACLGTWHYPNASYVVTRNLEGLLHFDHEAPNGGRIAGVLHPRAPWFEGEVYAGEEHVGAIRLRPGRETGTLVSSFRAAPKTQGFGALAAAEVDWAAEVIAKREEPVAVGRIAGAQEPAEEVIDEEEEVIDEEEEEEGGASPDVGGWFTAAAWGFASVLGSSDVRSEVSTAATVSSTVSGKTEAPVKHTFIHFQDEEPAKELKTSHSAPGVLMTGPFALKTTDLKPAVTDADAKPAAIEEEAGRVQLAHTAGSCKPCAYFWGKMDGCRGGDSCKFCHLCAPGELKRRRREKDRFLRAKQRAAKSTSWSTASVLSH